MALRLRAARAPEGASADSDEARDELRATFVGLWRGEIEGDGFNRLVLLAGLTGRQVAVLRAYAKYLRQVGTTFSQRYIESDAGRPIRRSRASWSASSSCASTRAARASRRW